MLKWRTFPNEEHSQMQNHSQMQPCQMPRFAKCSSMRERCWIRTPTCELTAAKLRKGLKGRGNRTSAVFKLQCHPRGPLLCLQRLQFTSANSFNFFNVTSAKQKPANSVELQLLQFASAKKLTKLHPILKCHTKAWKLLQFTSARKLAKCFNPQLPANCFHSQVPNKGLQTASIPTSQENLRNAFNSPFACRLLEVTKCQELQTASILSLSTHAMLRRAMLRYVMLRYTMLRYAILHHAMLRPASQHHATLHHAAWFMPRYTLPCAP